MKIETRLSPNNADRQGVPVVAVVLHYDASMSERASVDWLCTTEAKASAHYLVARDGLVYQMVPVHRTAWHVGSGELTAPGQGTITRSINRSTIGIELGNCGPVYQNDTGWCWDDNGTMRPYRGLIPPVWAGLAYPSGLHVEEWWEPYPDIQIEALTELLVRIASMGYEVAVRNLVGHDEVSRPYGHKTDPGPLFPWTRFHRDVPRPLESTIVPG